MIYVLEENKSISTYCILLNKEALGLLQDSRCHHDLAQYFPRLLFVSSLAPVSNCGSYLVVSFSNLSPREHTHTSNTR